MILMILTFKINFSISFDLISSFLANSQISFSLYFIMLFFQKQTLQNGGAEQEKIIKSRLGERQANYVPKEKMAK